jgi:hypothetical protein
MKIRFQADADLNHIIVKATLRLEPGIDFQTAPSAGAEDLFLIWSASEPEEWVNCIRSLPI